MRPVNKGASPYVGITDYHDAEPYLGERIGYYCSYCEFPISHVPEVEHKECKNSGGALTNWENLLFGCKYCNSRKGQKVKLGGHDAWIWPDEHNTFLAFTYANGVPSVNTPYLRGLGGNFLKQAQTLFEDLQLGNNPSTNGKKERDKDKRWRNRMEAFNLAKESKEVWDRVKYGNYHDWLRQMIITATCIGFFSVWMMVFESEVIVRKALIEGYIGTSKECFDVITNPVLRNSPNL